jgi:hypothetical protein
VIDAAAPEPEKPPRKPRAKKGEPLQAGPVEGDPVPLDAPPAAEAAPDPAPALGVGELAFLFLDCIPVHGSAAGALKLGVWLAPVIERIKIRTGADWQFHEFRKASAILNQFAKLEPLPPALIVDSRSPEASCLWEYLISKTANGLIIQGTK